MEQRLIRKDFVPTDTPCAANCAIPLSSGIAWIAGDGDIEAAYGPTCIRKVVGNVAFDEARKDVPDLTLRMAQQPARGGTAKRRSSLVETAKNDGEIGSEQALDEEMEASRLSEAAAYLVLRLGRLSGLAGISKDLTSYAGLQTYFEYYKVHGTLGTGEVAHVLAVENKARNQRYKLCRENLLDVYATYHCLSRIALRQRGTELAWTKSIREALLRRLWLSQPQIRSVSGLTVHKDAFLPERDQAARGALRRDDAAGRHPPLG
jgi:hypothetical protein